jgi:carbon-monoxide dehydrogenase medium subunit
MKPAPFKYLSVASEPELVDALTEHGSDARLLAGGQSLVPMMNFRVASPAILIDVNRLHELNYIKLSAEQIEIGALTRQATLEDSAELAARIPLFREAVRHIGHRAVRNRGTIGGSLALAYPGAELPLLAVTLGAELYLRSPRGERKLAARDFLLGPLDTALDEDEYIRCITLPTAGPFGVGAFVEVARRHGDFAIAASAVLLELDADGCFERIQAGIAGGTGAPVRLTEMEGDLFGHKPDDPFVGESVRTATASIELQGDEHYPEGYRRQLLQTTLQRALAIAAKRAEHSNVL